MKTRNFENLVEKHSSIRAHFGSFQNNCLLTLYRRDVVRAPSAQIDFSYSLSASSQFIGGAANDLIKFRVQVRA